jgi:erythromycin esterase-like protein
MLANRDSAAKAVDALEVWINAIASRVQPTQHALALRMIAENFRHNIELCVRAGGSMRKWQEIRDGINARNVIELRNKLSASHKMMVWAHHSHVMHNATGTQIPSMGQHLHEMIGRELYTIGTFAGGGRVIDGALFGERNVSSLAKVGVERMLAALHRDAYFVDLRTLPTDDANAGWLVEQRSRFETMSRRTTILAKDFDGAIYIAQVHPSPFNDRFVFRWLLRIWGFVIEHAIGFALLIVTGIGFAIHAIVRRIVRWRRRR